jgi:tetratricopeptide (TPR) repeat protein
LLVVGAALVMYMSNREVTTPEGVPLISNVSQYNDTLRRAVDLSKGPLEAYDLGDELTAGQLNDLREAARLYDGVDLFWPTKFAPYLPAGKIYYILGDQELAQERLQQCIENAPLEQDPSVRGVVNATVYEAHYSLSLVKFALGDYKAAYAEANIAASGVPNSANYLAARASAAVQLKKVAEARKDVEQALKLDPNNKKSLQLQTLLSHTKAGPG